MALTHAELHDLRAMLERRRSHLLEELHEEVERARQDSYGELAGSAPDSGDQAVADLIADLEQADVSRDLGELQDIEAARKRVAYGTYGLCVDCGGDIGSARLHAEPAAARCIDCQERHEHTYAGSAAPRL